MMFMGVFWLLVIVVIARWLLVPAGRERLPPGEAESTRAEVARLREEVDRLGAQVERLTEEQSFLLRLLEAPRPPQRLEPGAEAPPAPEPTPEGNE